MHRIGGACAPDFFDRARDARKSARIRNHEFAAPSVYRLESSPATPSPSNSCPSAGGRTWSASPAGCRPAELYPVDAIREATDRALKRWGTRILGIRSGGRPVRVARNDRGAHVGGIRLQVLRRERDADDGRHAGARPGRQNPGRSGRPDRRAGADLSGALDAWRPRQPVYEKIRLERRSPPGFDAALARAKFVYAVPNYSNPTGALGFAGETPRAAGQGSRRRHLVAGGRSVSLDPFRRRSGTRPARIRRRAIRGCLRRTSHLPGNAFQEHRAGTSRGWAIAETRRDRKADPGQAVVRPEQQHFSRKASRWNCSKAVSTASIRVRSTNSIASAGTRSAARPPRASANGSSGRFRPAACSCGCAPGIPASIPTTLYQVALEEKVAFVPGSVFDPDGKDCSAMRVNFTRSSPEVIAEGCAPAGARHQALPASLRIPQRP